MKKKEILIGILVPVFIIFSIFIIVYIVMYISKFRDEKIYINNEILYSQQNFENIEGAFKLESGNLNIMKELLGEVNQNIYILNKLKENKDNRKKELREERKLITEFQCLKAIYSVSSKVNAIILKAEKISTNSDNKSLEKIVVQSKSVLYGENMSLLNTDSSSNYLPRLITKSNYNQTKENLVQSILLAQSKISMNE